MKRLLSIAFALAAACALAVEDDVIQATGIASTYRAAINEALVTALEQHDGITISSTEVGNVSESGDATSLSVNGQLDERTKTSLNDSIAKSMKKWSDGKIKSYEVLSDSFENGKYRVEVAVHFPGKYELGLPEGNRRRMVVADFRPETGDSFYWYGKADSSTRWASTLAEKLNERLTQTRKFTMLDRKFSAEVNAELARLSGKNAAKADSARLGQQLGTDYLVVGSVRFFSVAAPGVNPLTGQVLPVSSQPFCEVNYRVLLAPTGQIKWSETLRLDAADFQSATIDAFACDTADAAAAKISDGLMSNIFPFEVVGRNGAGEILIGEGGKSLAVGDRLTVYGLGEDVVDSRTGEVLDQVETPLGDVEVVRVSAKISYAKVLGGDAEKMVAGSRLRKVVPPPAPASAASPVTTTVTPAQDGGVVVPF